MHCAGSKDEEIIECGNAFNDAGCWYRKEVLDGGPRVDGRVKSMTK